MHVELEYLRFKNCLSYGAKEVTHTFEPGLTAISGRNGAGKSTFLEVISYNWFGKPYRKIKLEALINRENKKGLETETGIIIDRKDRYRIIRYMKPNKLQIFKNDQPIEMLSSKVLDQEDITKILGIDYKMFKQIVSLAVTYNKPFLTQEAAEKREIVESIFNIKIIGSMLDVLKKKITTEKVKYAVNKKTVEMLEENINIMRKNIIDVKKSVSEFEETKKHDAGMVGRNISTAAKEIGKIQAEIKSISDDLTILETKKTALTDTIVEKEVSLMKLSDDTENPNILALSTELKKITDRLSDITSQIIALENTPVVIEADIGYKTLMEQREKLITSGVDLKKYVDEFAKLPVDYSTDSDYSVLLDQENKLCTRIDEKDTQLNTIQKGLSADDTLKKWNIDRDGLMRKKNDCVRGVEEETGYIDYLKSNDVCRKCKTKITDEFRAEEIKKSYSIIDTNNADIKNLDADIINIQTCIDSMNVLLAETATLKNQLSSLQNHRKARQVLLDNEKQQKLSTLRNDLLLLKTKIQTTDNQIANQVKHINDEHGKKTSGLKSEKTNLELSINIKQTKIDNIKKEKIKIAEEEISALKYNLDLIKVNITNKINDVSRNQKYIEITTEQIKKHQEHKIEIENRKPAFDLPELEKEFTAKITDFKTAYAENTAMADNLKVYDITASMLSEEGIKSFFFRRLTPILNAKINEYLDKFDIPVRCEFNEQMEERIYNIGNDGEEVSYYSYSEGEKKSIDTAILMSFIDITKAICNWTCNILLIDELIDGQVDFARLEKMFDCLREFSGSGMIPSIYIISHRQLDDIQNFFKRIITINKVNGFSELTVRKV